MTRNLPANPMQALIAAAARTKSTTGATAAYKRRLEASGPQVVLADVSQSMELPAGGSLRRIDHLRSALDAVPEHLLMSFASAPQWQPSRYLPDPSGGTALHWALDLAAGRAPSMTLVISDGEPNDEDAALAAAGRLTGTISVIYCGREDNVQALGFMRRLARAGTGAVSRASLGCAAAARAPSADHATPAGGTLMLQHLTLNTGDIVAVPQSASVQRVMRRLRPIVEAGGGPLPDEPLWHLHLMPLADGATMMQIADEPGLSKRPIVMGIAAWRPEIADEAWDMAMQCYLPLERPLRMVRLWRDTPDAPKLPWLAVWLLPHIITADRDTLLSLGRVEQAVAMLLMGAP